MTFRRMLLALPLVAASAGLCALMPEIGGVASAAYPGANGAVVFVSFQTGHSHIYITASGGIRDLTGAHSTALDAGPKFSPNGRMIAFTRINHGHLPSSEIFVMSPTGSKLKRLTDTPLGNSDPTWSPDGSQIAFVSYRSGNVPNIFIMRADGTHVRQITHDNSSKSQLAWSPKGDRIAFAREILNHGLADIWTVKTNGSHLVDLTNDPRTSDGYPSYSPDGKHIVYAGGLHPRGSVGGDLWIMNANGSGSHPLQHEDNGYSDGNYPAWSPDGKKIAFGANNGSGYFHLWVVPAGGGQNSELVTNRVPGGNPVDQQVDWQPRH